MRRKVTSRTRPPRCLTPQVPIAAGVTTMTTLPPQMEGQVFVAILAARVFASDAGHIRPFSSLQGT